MPENKHRTNGNFVQARLARPQKEVHFYSLSHLKPPKSDARVSPKTARLARRGRWKAASAISTQTLTKLRSWGETGAGTVSKPTSSQVTIFLCLNRRLT